MHAPEDRGRSACKKVRELTDTVALKFSGGKDSVATWLVLREFFPKIVPIFHYWIPDLDFVERTVRLYEDFFEAKIIRIPHPNFINFLAVGAYQPPHRWNVIEEFDADQVEYDEVVDWVCEDLGMEDYWVAVGIKASDSPIRALTVKKHGAWTPSKRLFYPVADMNKAQLVDLLRRTGAPVSEDYDVFGRSFDGLQFRYLNRVRERYPEDYRKILRWFPLAEAEFARKDAHESQKSR